MKAGLWNDAITSFESALQLMVNMFSYHHSHLFGTIIGPALINQLPPSIRSTLLTGEPSASFRSLKIELSSRSVSHALSTSDWCALLEVLYLNVQIQYNLFSYSTIYLVTVQFT